MDKFMLIAGPCAIESFDCLDEVAGTLIPFVQHLKIDFYFKASFDKANRSSIYSYRGLGLEKGLEFLQKIKEKYNVKILTDIHEPWQAEAVSKIVDMIQIPAFLCRQTDLLIAAAKTGKPVNVKKAQFLAPWDMARVAEKLETAGCNDIFLCERGSTFGYNTLVVDMTSIYEMKKLGYPVIFDATHSVQKPGALGVSTGGNREHIETLAKAAVAAGADGLFMEVHPDPDSALSDGPNMISLKNAKGIISRLFSLWLFMKNTYSLDEEKNNFTFAKP